MGNTDVQGGESFGGDWSKGWHCPLFYLSRIGEPFLVAVAVEALVGIVIDEMRRANEQSSAGCDSSHIPAPCIHRLELLEILADKQGCMNLVPLVPLAPLSLTFSLFPQPRYSAGVITGLSPRHVL